MNPVIKGEPAFAAAMKQHRMQSTWMPVPSTSFASTPLERYLVTSRDRVMQARHWSREFRGDCTDYFDAGADTSSDVGFTITDLSTGETVLHNLNFREAAEVARLFGKANGWLCRRYLKERRKALLH